MNWPEMESSLKSQVNLLTDINNLDFDIGDIENKLKNEAVWFLAVSVNSFRKKKC